MPLSTDKLPNLPLTGPELQQYTVALLRDELEVRSVPEFTIVLMLAALDAGCRNDFLFNYGTSYPNISITLTVRLHRCGEVCAFSIKPEYKHQQPLPDQLVMVRSMAPPILERDSNDEQVEAFTLKTTVANPNLIRIHYGLPITRTVRKDPRPGALFPEFDTEVVEVNPEEFPPCDEPQITDESEQFSSTWGVKEVMPSGRGDVQESGNTSSLTAAGADEAVTAPAASHHVPRKKRGWNKTA